MSLFLLAFEFNATWADGEEVAEAFNDLTMQINFNAYEKYTWDSFIVFSLIKNAVKVTKMVLLYLTYVANHNQNR